MNEIEGLEVENNLARASLGGAPLNSADAKIFCGTPLGVEAGQEREKREKGNYSCPLRKDCLRDLRDMGECCINYKTCPIYQKRQNDR